MKRIGRRIGLLDLEPFYVWLCEDNSVEVTRGVHASLFPVETEPTEWTSRNFKRLYKCLKEAKPINLYMMSQKLKRFDPVMCKLSLLNSLYLANNELRYLPDEIGNLENLQVLDLNGNMITAFPRSMNRLSKLKVLDFTNNKIDSIEPETFSGLISLEKMFFSFNKIEKVPTVLAELENLKLIFEY